MSIPRSLPQVRRWSELLHVRQAGNIIYDRPGRSAFQPRKIRDPSLTAKISKHCRDWRLFSAQVGIRRPQKLVRSTQIIIKVEYAGLGLFGLYQRHGPFSTTYTTATYPMLSGDERTLTTESPRPDRFARSVSHREK